MSRKFGKIAQIGYVVRDIDAAMDNWIEHGVGPWFYVDRVQTDYFRYRGADSAMEMSVALANSGDIQIELIQQRNDAPRCTRTSSTPGGKECSTSRTGATTSRSSTTTRSPRVTRSGKREASAASKADSPTSTPSTNRAPSSRSPISAVPKDNSSST